MIWEKFRSVSSNVKQKTVKPKLHQKVSDFNIRTLHYHAFLSIIMIDLEEESYAIFSLSITPKRFQFRLIISIAVMYKVLYSLI